MRGSKDQPEQLFYPAGLVGIVTLLLLAIFGGVIYPQLVNPQVQRLDAPTAVVSMGKTSRPSGDYANPVGLGKPFNIYSGRLRVNALSRAISQPDLAVDRFNTVPAAGEEWAVVNITFFCEMPGDKTCNTANIHFEITGKEQRAYNAAVIMPLEVSFNGLVKGGESISSSVGTIVKQSDTNLLLVVVENTQKRIHFRTE